MRLGHRVMLISHHTHNGAPRRAARARIARARLQLLANRVFAWKELVRKGLVDDHHLRRSQRIRIGKVSPFSERGLHRLEIVARDQRDIRRRQQPLRHRMFRILKRDVGAVFAHRENQRAGSGLHTRQCSQPFKILAVELRPRLLIPVVRRLKAKSQQMVGMESQILMHQLHKA